MIGSPVTTVEETELRCTEQLAQFFPGVRRVALPCVVKLRQPGSGRARDVVTIEFAGPEEAIFVSALPLEFEDRVLIENDRGQDLKAMVIAVQYHQGKSAVAVKILDGPFSWMKRP